MKRLGGLFESIADLRTLMLAAANAARGKRQRPEVARFLARLEAETAEIGRALRNHTYRFGVYRTFAIRDPKSRIIHAPPFRDRVVHHAIVAVTGPVFERGAIAHTYACRPGRGQHAALERAGQWMRRRDWFLKIDVARYYESIDHAALRVGLARRFRERPLLALFDRLLDSYAAAPGRGLPIGALTSQYLGNFFLDPVDHWIHEQLGQRRYLRYMDDMLLFGDRAALLRARDGVVGRLASVGLTAKVAVLNRCAVGVPFLGFVLYPDRVRLNRQGRRRLRRRLGETERAHARGRIGEPELQARAAALFAHARFADDGAWRREVLRLSRFGEAQEPEPGAPGRVVEQRRQEVPFRVPQQEQAVQPQQEQRLPGLSGSQYDGGRGVWPQSQPADNAPFLLRETLGRTEARAHPSPGQSGLAYRSPRCRWDESRGKPPASADIQLEFEWPEAEKGDAGAPTAGGEDDEA